MNYDVDEKIEIDDTLIIEYVKDNYDPEDVFTEEKLNAWAENNNWEPIT